MTRATTVALLGRAKCPWGARRCPPRMRHLRCEAVFAEHLRTTRPETRGRRILFAVDDSDAAEEGAQFAIKNVAQPGDCVHFVHVVTDSRTPFVSVGGVGSDEDEVYYSSSMDVAEAYSLEEHQQLLEAKAEQMLKRRVAKNLESDDAISTKYHLPILTRPESASDIATVMADLASNLAVDIFALVSPSSGVFLECGSVGYHCYEKSDVPVLLLPSAFPLELSTTDDNVIMVLVNSQEEREAAVDWIQRHISHMFEPYKFFIACLDSKCTMRIPQETRDMAAELDRMSSKLHPACVVMYGSEERTILDQLEEVPFVADYDEVTRYPIIVLPKWHPPSESRKSYWSDYTYSEDELLLA